MANKNMTMSADGMTALRQREAVTLRYYSDSANNCTFGIGTLAHLGPCTAEELQRPVILLEVNAQFAIRVRDAEKTVRRHVRNHQLSQTQFDALVSFTYNSGSTGAIATLNAANRGQLNEVVRHINNYVYIHPRDRHGRRLAPIKSRGLVNRRREEAAPFQQDAGR